MLFPQLGLQQRYKINFSFIPNGHVVTGYVLDASVLFRSSQYFFLKSDSCDILFKPLYASYLLASLPHFVELSLELHDEEFVDEG